MRIIFFGSPEFALPSLDALVEGPHHVVGVVTQPDRPAGRGHAPAPPPVKLAALQYGLPIFQPERVSEPEPVERLRSLDPDVFIVAAYGQILRQRLLDVPELGCLNVHASLLPRHRGASPIAAAILAGDEVTGITIMEMERGLDTGPMVARVEEPISPFDTTGTLEPRLARAGASLLAETLEAWASGDIQAERQDDSLATYALQIKREDALLDWTEAAAGLWRRVRAYNPWPVAYTLWRGEQLRVLEAWPIESRTDDVPGTVLPVTSLPSEAGAEREQTFAVQTGDGALAVRRLQRQGKRPMSGLEFLRGQRDFVGSQLGH
jgi:methionyl-tRNA formyltransferase